VQGVGGRCKLWLEAGGPNELALGALMFGIRYSGYHIACPKTPKEITLHIKMRGISEVFF
jgi:hypothetical protein